MSVAEPAPPRTGRSRPPRARVLVNLLFVVALGFTLIGLVETAFVIYDALTGHSLSARMTPDLELGIRSWTFHHAMRPGYDIPPVRTNSFGLRSPEVSVPKRPGTYRILLLGDSFTFGFRSAGDAVFARKLERLLRDRGNRSAEVVNAGVLSYCPLLEYLQYRNELSVLDADLVILNFDMSDVQDHLEYSRSAVFSPDGDPLFVTEPSLRTPPGFPRLLSFEWVRRHVLALTRKRQSTLEGSPFARDTDRYIWALDGGPEMDREVQSTLAPILSLATLLRHQGIPLVLATYPQPWQVSADATPLPPVREQYNIGYNRVHLNDRAFRKVEAFASSHGIPFVNATDAFRSAPRPADLFLPADFHFTARGHALYAEVLAAQIASRSGTPASH